MQNTIKKSQWIIFTFGLIYLFVRAKYGFCFNDEPFCVTLGQRIYRGDALIAHEWQGCQFFSGVMFPLYSLYRLFSQTNEGILLFLRNVYCVLWWLCCVFVSNTVSKSQITKITVFLFLLFFSPLDYMTVSYTSIGLISVLGIGCILYKISTEKEQKNIVTTVVFSLIWAVLVLSVPLMILAYVALFVVSLIGAHWKHKKEIQIYFTNLRVLFTCSIIIDGILALVFLVYMVLLRADLSAVIGSIPHIFADPEHPSYGLVYSVRNLIDIVISSSPVYILVSLLLFVYSFVKKTYASRFILFGATAILYINVHIKVIRTQYTFNQQMLNIVFLGAVSFAMLTKKNWKLFFSFYVFSIVYMFMNGLTSNTGIYAVSMTLVVAGVASVIFIIQLLNELREQYHDRKILSAFVTFIFCLVLCLQITSEFYVKSTRQYWDEAPYKLTETIPYGAAKGLKTTPEKLQTYTSRYIALKYLLDQVETEGKSFFSCTSAPYLYLDADLDFATFSAWSFGYEDGLNERVLNYQKINPDKIPDIIYCESVNDILPFIDSSYTQFSYEGHYLFVR